jgi:hypothetical protein
MSDHQSYLSLQGQLTLTACQNTAGEPVVSLPSLACREHRYECFTKQNK